MRVVDAPTLIVVLLIGIEKREHVDPAPSCTALTRKGREAEAAGDPEALTTLLREIIEVDPARVQARTAILRENGRICRDGDHGPLGYQPSPSSLVTALGSAHRSVAISSIMASRAASRIQNGTTLLLSMAVARVSVAARASARACSREGVSSILRRSAMKECAAVAVTCSPMPGPETSMAFSHGVSSLARTGGRPLVSNGFNFAFPTRPACAAASRDALYGFGQSDDVSGRAVADPARTSLRATSRPATARSPASRARGCA